MALRATWIWFPGDFEIWLSNRVQTRRAERDVFVPPFWRMDSHHVTVSFIKEVDLSVPDQITIVAEGRYNVSIDGAYVPISDGMVAVPAGKHVISIIVYNTESVPTIWVHGQGIVSDRSWRASISRNPLALENTYADSGDFDSPERCPSKFTLPTKECGSVSVVPLGCSVFADFGAETFGFVVLRALQGSGSILVCYGESEEEARSLEKCETIDRIAIQNRAAADYIMPTARAFRYVSVHADGVTSFSEVAMLHEFARVDERGRFRSSSERLNRIWDVAVHTLRLNTREFFLDGIKRDRWLWSGDAVQTYLMNYYTFFDEATVRRTTWALRGKDPVEQHINTIIDYSFYWFIGIYDYHLFTGDADFVSRIYPRMVTLMEFCLSRRNADGFVEAKLDDWLFLDWAEIPKNGELCAEQLLLCRALEATTCCARLVGRVDEAERYEALAAQLRHAIIEAFWDNERGVLVHHRVNGSAAPLVTRYANMFAILYGYLSPNQRETATTRGLLSEDILKITTPYMRFYELEALCCVGQQPEVTKQMLDYWGGMLDCGATSFWELYDPAEKDGAQYAMYGRPFGKSLCHAWGASPVYLLGRYYLGVRPTSAGFATYEVEPNLGGLEWIEGTVPSPRGDITLRLGQTEIHIKAFSGGMLRFCSETKPTCSVRAPISRAPGFYELELKETEDLMVKYTAMRNPHIKIS